MQLRFKKTCLLITIIVYFVSFLFQSNFVFFQTWAQEKANRVNIVAVLVDSELYKNNEFVQNLKWYTTEYVQQQLSDTKALVIPLNLQKIHAYDIYRMMENVYFDGLENVNSSLIGLIMFGDIPLPVVNQNGYIFPTVYPYVDFENQKYVWDSQVKYFVPNDNPAGQAEIWHGLINYGKDIQKYLDFFEKIKKYKKNPDNFIGDSMRYDDFVAQKEGFLDENFGYYRNRVMFAEDLGYQRYSPLMKKMFEGEKVDDAVNIVGELEKATNHSFGLDDIPLDLNDQGNGSMYTTKMVQQEIDTSFVSDYNDLFSQLSSSTMRENIFAGGRRIKEYVSKNGEKSMITNADTSASKIQLKDEILLGNNELQGLIENLNDLMESMIDKKIEEKKLSMDIVLPLNYKEVTKKRITFKCTSLVKRYENYYFGNNARLIDSAEDLSIYRGTYRNLLDLSGVTYSSLLVGKNPIKSDYDKTDLKLKSIGGSYDIFSNQVEGNRGYSMMSVEGDLDIYDQNKTQKNTKTKYKSLFGRVRKKSWPESCSDNSKKEQCELLYDFAKRWWGGASSINLLSDSVSRGRYELNDYLATDSWRPIFQMDGFQSLLQGDDEGSSGTQRKHGASKGPQSDATSFKAYIKYASPTQREGWKTFRWALVGRGYEIYENHTPDVHIDFKDINYWDLDSSIVKVSSSSWSFSNTAGKIFNISRKQGGCGGGGSREYSYKVISSVVKHTSTTEDQINGIDRDKYGDNGTLGKYYSDVKTEYENLQSDMYAVLRNLSGLVLTINSGSDYISGKFAELYSGGNMLLNLSGDLLEKEDELLSLRSQLILNPGSENIRQSISGLELEIDLLRNQIETGEEYVKTILEEILNYVKVEKSQLIEVYGSIVGLYLENIFGALEFIVYLEGGNPEDYYGSGSNDLLKVGFLPSWISDINDIVGDVKDSEDNIVRNYEEIYSLIQKQREIWSDLTGSLDDLVGEDNEVVNAITDEMDQIFVVEEDMEEDDGDVGEGEESVSDDEPQDLGPVVLSGGTARESMDAFNEELNTLSLYFSNLIEVDKTGPAIVKLARSDSDFIGWLRNNSINYKKFSDEDWISQYAQWAKGPGYDKSGPKENHDLLVGVSEHMSGINILTPDRPIDSPRYVSMQSIAGNEMKFIYPDLFKVEVYSVKGKNSQGYDIHQLLTPGEIKKNLIKYLKGKVDEYNNMVQNECNNALKMDDYFFRLSGLGYKDATPDLIIHSCNKPFKYEDFVDAIGGEKMLDTVSEVLYYQSLTNKTKLSTGSVAEDIELIKNSFNLNDKREKVIEDYLVGGNEKTKNPIFEIPSYEVSGYEVAFVNSDGRDYIFPSNQVSDEINKAINGNSFDSRSERKLTSREKDFEDKCNIPSNGTLPLFKMDGTSPWLKGFKCWLEETLKNPVKIKLRFDSSLGELLLADSLGDYIKNSELVESFEDWWDSMDKYGEEWKSVFSSDKKYDSDKTITQLQVNADKHNQEVTKKDDGLSRMLSEVYDNLRIENTNLLLSDNNPSNNLRIESMSDLNISITFKGTGDGCLKLNSTELCNGNSFTTKNFNPKSNPFSGLIVSSDHVAGKVGLIMQINVGGGYIEHVLKYTVAPSVLTGFEIKTDDKRKLAGMLTPISIVGYDQYNNVVSWGLQKYTFKVSKGRFFKNGIYQQSFTTNDLRDLNFYYQAPSDAVDGTIATIQIKTGEVNVISEYNMTIVQGSPVIKLNGKEISKNEGIKTYKLTSNESIYTGGKLDVSKLQKLNIDIYDLKGKIIGVDGQISVSSENGLFVFGTVNGQSNGKTAFYESSSVSMKLGHAVVYFYPSTLAGDDTINIEIPGLDTRKIDFRVYPAETSVIKLNIKDEYVELGGQSDFEVFTTDVWGNSTDATLYLNYDSTKVEFPELKTLNDGTDIAIITGGYLKTKIKGKGAGLTEVTVGSTSSVQFKVDKHIFPESGLNVMYLNYFGNDWGNQWGYFSNNNKYIESVMSKSDKIITTTTQLISEDKIKKTLWKINPGFKITNFDDINTTLRMGKGKINLNIGGLSDMSIGSPYFKWMNIVSLDTIYTLENNKNSTVDDYAFFVPVKSSYKIVDGILYNDGERVASIIDGEVVLNLESGLLKNGENVWSVVYKGVNYGSMIIHYSDFIPNVKDFNILGNRYLVDKVFTNGTTDNMSSVGLFDGLSDFELDTSYKSIQDSRDVDERIGFIGDFKNITLFGEGEIVGEATKNFGSELLINLGDPVLSRKGVNNNVYGTSYDGGIGQEIYADSENSIFGVYQIDFNKDGLKDWLFVYLDGSLKLAKNYGGSPDLRNMQELLHIAVHIQNVFVGDVDGDGYEDILIFTDNNQIRVYLNDGGKFDVDGRVVCLNHSVFEGEKSATPSNLGGLNQFFVEDMDLDGKVDIVTYDKMGYIKVFYGGSTNGEPNYLSTQKYACDAGWYDRQLKNTTIVTALGVQISNEDIFDNSMIHWKGLSGGEITITESELSDYGVNFDPNSLEKLVKQKERNSDGSIEDVTRMVMDADSFDIKEASRSFINESAKFVDVTLYENTLLGSTGSNYVFIPSSFLDPKNPDDYCSVWKNYTLKQGGKILMDGDLVTVRVTVKASDKYSCFGAYGDVIQGPRNVYYDGNKTIKGIRFLQNKRNAEVKRMDGKFSYIVDNIELNPGEKMVFEYDLEYHQLPLRKMSITYNTFWSDDKYPDIKLQSIDGCVKDFSGFVNSADGKRQFLAKNIPLQELIDKEYILEDENTEDLAENVIGYGSDASQIPGIYSDRINRIKLLGEKSLKISDDEEGRANLKNMLYQNLEDLNMSFSVDLSIFEEQTEAIDDIIDTMMKGMCNGFSFGGSNNCKGLPVPFNQAFLAPGKYHLFGCWNLPMGPLEGGLPTFFFPGTLWVPTPAGTVPIPIPWGLKSSADGFLWPGKGTYPSFIRIYAAPTLTAQLGIAVCMGKYMDEHIFPSPLADVAGNCVVFAVKPQCKNGGGDGDGKDINNPNEVYNQIVNEVKDSGICLQSQKGPQVTDKGRRSSPFNLYSYSSSYHLKDTSDPLVRARDWIVNNIDVNGGTNYQVDFSTSFLGIIEMEMDSYIRSADDSSNDNNSIFIGDVDILGGSFSVNKIRGGIRQGIRSLLIDNWLDPQIRYIASHLTKMHVNVRLPDVSNLINNEVQTMENVSENFSKIWNNEGEKQDISKISEWSDISYDNLNKLNKSISNPFESLASLMNESNIINISTEQITVKIPMIFAEDIDAYSLYLQQRLEVNSDIVDDWKALLESFVTKCSSIEDEEEREICYTKSRANLNSFIEFERGDWQKLQDQIYTNLMILQEYRNFPFEIYEWIHVIDRYMSEISSIVSNTIGYLSYWTSTNSQRFVGYVDAIVLMLNIIKTYQLIIDFSTERGQNCGSCARDTYDQYSCKLSFLCNMIELPIIQIPNFRLPNVTIDLTQIDLSLDIVLPEFNFQPVRVNLPDLPNLPEPPSISINIDFDFGLNFKLFDLPSIPLLPEPPELPELPSFIPEVELELPILPPAPELPKLPNEIESIIDFSKIIGKIYCIVKGKFGLVGESSVKAKIEQLTQRTYEVKWIDNIMDFTNFSVAPIHTYGVDYEISSIVDLQFNFSDFYDYLDTLTKSINNLTTSSVDWVSKKLDDAIPNESLQKLSDEIDGSNYDVNMRIGKSDLSSLKDFDVKGLESDEIQYVDYDLAKNRLEEVLAYIGNQTKDTTFRDDAELSIEKIENQINRESRIESNLDGLEKVKNDVFDYLNEEKENYSKLENMINNDYKGFLAMVDSQHKENDIKGGIDTGKILTFNTKLFNVDSSTKDSIETVSKSSPYGVLIDNKKTIIDGYWNAVNSNSASDLGLTQQQYLVLHDSIGSIKNQVSTLYSVAKPISSTELIAKNSRISTNKSLVSANNSSRLGSNLEVADAVDPSALSQGIYSKIQDGPDKGKLTKIVYSDSFVDEIGDRYYYNKPLGQDLILWDENAVYVKCSGQKCSGKGGLYKSYYHSDVVDEIPNRELYLSFDKDTKLKISDVNEEVKNWKVLGQTYDTLSFSWRLDDVDGYLIKLVDRIDYSYEKVDHTLAKQVLYVLALPKGTDLNDLYSKNIKLELLRGTEKIKNIYGKSDLVQIVYYDVDKDFADAVLTDIDRKWYYARIATLNLENDTYNIDSPWSNQIVLGKQMVGDDQPPFSSPVLYRTSTSEIVGEGYDLEGYVGTKYELRVGWKDNVALSYINLSKNGKILDEKYVSTPEDTVKTAINIHTTQENEEYTVLGIDQYGNRSEKTIKIHYSIPDINITDVSRNSDGQTVAITAELSQDIDQGNVSFQRKRGTTWKTMKTKNGLSSLNLAHGQKRVVGTPYSAGNEIAMYDKNGEIMALMNPITAEIKLQTGYNDFLDVRVIVQDSSVLQIYNNSTQSSVFSLSIPSEKCLKIEADNYTISDLPEKGKMGIFNGGKTIFKDGTNILFVSPTCRLYSEFGLEGTYSYDRELEAVVVTLYQWNDLSSKKNPIKIWMKIKSFLDS